VPRFGLFGFVRFQVLTAACMKIAFWDMVPCNIDGVNPLITGAYCLIIRAITLMMGGSTNL
jgi:hydroxylamine reductase (hybrid-cluster protein)